MLKRTICAMQGESVQPAPHREFLDCLHHNAIRSMWPHTCKLCYVLRTTLGINWNQGNYLIDWLENYVIIGVERSFYFEFSPAWVDFYCMLSMFLKAAKQCWCVCDWHTSTSSLKFALWQLVSMLIDCQLLTSAASLLQLLCPAFLRKQVQYYSM